MAKQKNSPDKLLNIAMAMVIVAFGLGALGVAMSFITSSFSGLLFATVGGGLFSVSLLLIVIALAMRFFQKRK
jgi:hypothetical protein